MVATHSAAAVASTPEGVTPAAAASAPLIRATAVAPALLGSAPVLRLFTPVVRVAVAVLWEAGLGLAGPRALESSSLVSSNAPVDEGSARGRSSRGDPLPPGSGEPGSSPSRRPPWVRYFGILVFWYVYSLTLRLKECQGALKRGAI